MRRQRVVALLVSAVLVSFQPTKAATDQGQERLITVTGEGQVSVKPDVAQTNLGVRVSALTVSQAMAQNRARMQKVLEVLRSLGIKEKDIATNRFSLHYEEPQPRADGNKIGQGKYYVENMAQVTIRDLDKIDEVIEETTKVGADNIWGIQFTVDNPEQAVAQARQLAAIQARAKAEQLVQLHGAKLGKVMSIKEEKGREIEPANGILRAMAVDQPINAGELTFSASLRVVYSIE